jgi:hypothetical protein
MERYCPECKRTTPHDGQRCSACGQVSVVDESRAANWQPVALPKGLVDDVPPEAPAPAPPEAAPEEQSDERTPTDPILIEKVLAQAPEPAHRPEPVQARRVSARLEQPVPSAPALAPARRVSFGLIGGLSAVGLAILLVVLYLASRGDTALRYVVWPSAEVFDGPYPGPALAVLHRGEQVHVLQSNGDYWQIRDPDGRQGYVEKRFLAPARPGYTSGTAFVGCRQYLTEATNKTCLRRADEQVRTCLKACPRTEIDNACRVQCQAMAVECQTGCR